MRRTQLTPITKFLIFILVTTAALLSYDTRFIAVLALISMFCHLNPKMRVQPSLGVLICCHLLLVYFANPNYGVTLYHYNITWLYNFTLQEGLYLLTLLLKDIVILNFLQYFIVTSQPSEIAASLNHIKIPYRIAYKISQLLTLGPRVTKAYTHLQQVAMAQNISLSKTKAFLFLFRNRREKNLKKRHFGKKAHRTWYTMPTLKMIDKLCLLLALFSVIISISLIVINGSRLWNPFL